MEAWKEADNLPDRLRIVMRKRDMTQSELARRSGLSTSLVSQLLSGERGSGGGITFETVLKLKKALRVPHAFFELEGSRKGNHAREDGELSAQYAEVL